MPNYSVNSRTLRITQLLGFDCSMVHLDLAAPGTAFCPIPTIFISFRGPRGPAPPSCGNRPVRRATLAARGRHPRLFLYHLRSPAERPPAKAQTHPEAP